MSALGFQNYLTEWAGKAAIDRLGEFGIAEVHQNSLNESGREAVIQQLP